MRARTLRIFTGGEARLYFCATKRGKFSDDDDALNIKLLSLHLENLAHSSFIYVCNTKMNSHSHKEYVGVEMTTTLIETYLFLCRGEKEINSLESKSSDEILDYFTRLDTDMFHAISHSYQ